MTMFVQLVKTRVNICTFECVYRYEYLTITKITVNNTNMEQ